VFAFEGAGTFWTQVDQINPSGGTAWQGFGFSMSCSGGVLLVGGVGSETADVLGSAYVFERAGSSWIQQAELAVAGLADNDYYGWSVSISGDRAVVGAPGGGNFAPRGAAYVFEKQAGQWKAVAKLTEPGGVPGNMYGRSVAIDGDRILVGCPSEPTHDTAGSVYVAERIGSAWQQTAKLVPIDGQVDDSFGASVSLVGDRAAIGAPGDDDNGHYAGSAYIFERAAGTWTQAAKLLPAEGVAREACGDCIALTEDVVLVGSHSEASRDGSAYVFRHTAAGWEEVIRLAEAGAGNTFGTDLAVNETYAVVSTNRAGAFVFNTPEPATLSLLALGALVLVRRRRRRR